MEELEKIKHLDVTKINDRGYYFDMDNGNMFMLNDEQLQFAREFFGRPDLAPKRIQHTNTQKPKKKMKLDREGSNRNANRSIVLPNLLVRALLVAGVVVYVGVGFVQMNIQAAPKDMGDDISSSEVTIADSNQSSQQEIAIDEWEKLLEIPSIRNLPWLGVKSIVPEQHPIGSPYRNIEIGETIEKPEKEKTDDSKKEDYRTTFIRHMCDVFQVNFDVLYPQLVACTDNFTNSEYLNGRIANVTCKGRDVQADNEEALLIYFIRCAKQQPEKLGFDDTIHIKNEYDSGTDYAAMISYYSSIFKTDRCLAYAITQTETGWGSELFMNANNPAGLRADGNWWHFDTKEEGFIELVLELQKYALKGVTTIEGIGSSHAPVSDGNAGWVSTVTSIYDSVSAQQEEVFGDGPSEDTITYWDTGEAYVSADTNTPRVR